MNTARDSLEDDDYIDLRAIVARLWSQRWWIVTSAVFVTAAFTIVSFVMTPKYRATTVLVPADVDRGGASSLGSALGQLGGLASLAGLDIGGGGSLVEESLAVLRSREFTQNFIRDLEVMPKLYPRRWDEADKRWKGAERNWPTLGQGFRRFNKHVRTVSQDKKTGLITLQIEWRDPEEAARWANELVARLNNEMRARAIDSTTASVGYLQKELSATSEIDTRAAINRLMEAQINQRMFANVTKEYAFRIIDRALVPDRNDVVSPNKPLMIGLGAVLGLLLGSMLALVRSHWLEDRGARQ